MIRKPKDKREGIILLVVLGMLSLFSILTVTYLVFATQNRRSAVSLSRRQAREIDRAKVASAALTSVLRGSEGPTSAIYGHDMLGDLYGHQDGFQFKVVDAAGPNGVLLPQGDTYLPLDSGGSNLTPKATETAIPIALLAKTNFPAADPAYSGYSLDQQTTDQPRWARFPTRLFDRDYLINQGIDRVGLDVDDALTGRIVTFLEGPLKNLSFPIVRYFGDHRKGGNPNNKIPARDLYEEALSGQVVIDCEAHLDRAVTIGGTTRKLAEWLAARDGSNQTFVGALFFDNNGTGGFANTGFPGSDDKGYRFWINGRALNGYGFGWEQDNSTTPPNYNLNGSVVINAAGGGGGNNPNSVTLPSAFVGPFGYDFNSLPNGAADEPFDVADYNDFWLAHFADDPAAGANAPSFLRPALVNYILNASQSSLSSLSPAQLKTLILALQRATMRPLPIANGPDPQLVSDAPMRRFRWGRFSGSNPGFEIGANNTADGLRSPIDFSSNNTTYLATRLLDVARALVQGGWDVDNDGDGQVDSVWVDAGLEPMTMPDGTLVKPMVAYRIEDLGGRIDVNAAGSLAFFDNTYLGNNLRPLPTTLQAAGQATGSTGGGGGGAGGGGAGGPPPNAPTVPSSDAQIEAPTGTGYGPADITLVTLLRNTGRSVIARKYGRDQVAGYANDPRTQFFGGNNPPPVTGNDLFGLLRGFGRYDVHRPAMLPPAANTNPFLLPRVHTAANVSNAISTYLAGSMYGVPVDTWGRGTITIDRFGQPMVAWTTDGFVMNQAPFNNAGPFGEAVNDPYEFVGIANPVDHDFRGAGQPDDPYTLEELEELIRSGDWDVMPPGLTNVDSLAALVLQEANDPTVDAARLQRMIRSLTTRSRSYAGPASVLPAEYRDTTGYDPSGSGIQNRETAETNRGIVGTDPLRLFQRVIAEGVRASADEVRKAQDALWSVIAPEIRTGGKLNLNRPLGNGLDDSPVLPNNSLVNNSSENSGVGFVDEYLEELTLRFDNDDGDSNVDEADERPADFEVYGSANPYSAPALPAQQHRAPNLVSGTVLAYPADGTVETRDYVRIVPGGGGGGGGGVGGGPGGGDAGGGGNVSPTIVRDNRSLLARHIFCLGMLLTRDVSQATDTSANIYDFDFPHPDLDDIPQNLNAEEQREYKAWKLAQWAVNVVDFRDTDAIMTPFEYDTNPYDGWNVDGDPATDDGTDGVDNDGDGQTDEADEKQRHVVWGMEAPELVLTESIALHDRSVKDTDLDGSGLDRVGPDNDWGAQNGDEDPDQYRVPQGSLFLELYCPRSGEPLNQSPNAEEILTSGTGFAQVGGNGQRGGRGSDTLNSLQQRDGRPMAPPAELYRRLSDGTAALDLEREAPDGNPVWRVAISRSHTVNGLEARPQEDPLAIITGETEEGGNAIDKKRDTVTFDPANPHLFADPNLYDQNEHGSNYKYDRVVWFSRRDPRSLNANVLPRDTRGPESIYYNRFQPQEYLQNNANNASQNPDDAGAFLRGGQYAVVGPRLITYVGARDVDFEANPQTPYNEFVSPQRIVLAADTIAHFNANDTRTTPGYDLPNQYQGEIRPVLGILAAANTPSPAWDTSAPRGIGVNISEPIPRQNARVEQGHNSQEQYYPRAPAHKLNGSDDAYPTDAYHDYNAPNPAQAGTFPDEPFDSDPRSPLMYDFGPDGQRTGTRERYKTAYLQRLANPLQRYHAELNPYITVDWMSLDLTVFNGSEINELRDDDDQAGDNNTDGQTDQGDPDGDNEWLDPFDDDPYANGTGPEERFATRYKHGRGLTLRDGAAVDNETPVLPQYANVLWSYGTRRPARSQVATQIANQGQYAELVFKHEIVHQPQDANDNGAQHDNFSSTLGYLNYSFGRRFVQEPGNGRRQAHWFVGQPVQSFAWMTWLNRDYASPLEVMMVPATSASRLSLQFSTPRRQPNTVSYDPYTVSSNAQTTKQWNAQDRLNFRGDFGHLFNFFHHDNEIRRSPNLYRLLDWINVPDPYDDSRVMIPPTTFPSPINGDVTWPPRPENAGMVSAMDWHYRLPVEPFRPPYNWIEPMFRQGRVNLNTMHDRLIFRELVQGMAMGNEVEWAQLNQRISGGPFWSAFSNSRRGYAVPTDASGEPLALNSPAYQNSQPGLNTYPIRLHPSVDPDFPTQFAGAFRPSVMADIAPLIRGNNRNAWPNGTLAPDALRRDANNVGLARQAPNLSGGGGNNLLPQPMFMRDPQTANQATDQTDNPYHRYLGVTRMANTTSHQSNVFAVWTTVGFFELDPRTNEVGEEHGALNGEVNRIRSFSIVDRSIPVGYRPGIDINTEETVLLNRILD